MISLFKNKFGLVEEQGVKMEKYKCLDEYGETLLPNDLKEILHVGKNTVYKLLDEGTIKSIKIGNSYRIPKLYLIDYLYPNNDSVTKNQ